jgi:hypothetical protein
LQQTALNLLIVTLETTMEAEKTAGRLNDLMTHLIKISGLLTNIMTSKRLCVYCQVKRSLTSDASTQARITNREQTRQTPSDVK